ncbi:MAG: SatD family protein [Bacteroidota bacterium]|jgi:hypothetical protein
MKPQYCAVIGDINKSRSLQRRNKVQEKFKDAVVIINKEFNDDIASKFLVTLGDEFQGLLTGPSKSFQLVQRFRDLMDPVPFSFGIGIGALSTPLNIKEAIGMDGECFHRARLALVRAKKAKQEIFFDFEDDALTMVNALAAMLYRQKQLLSPSQKKILRLRNEGLNQLLIARRLRITKQAVSKTLKKVPIAEIEEMDRALNVYLDLCGKTESTK